MKKLLEKLEVLVDEATLLVREERARRAAPPMTTTEPVMIPYAPYVPSRTVPDWAQPWCPSWEITSGMSTIGIAEVGGIVAHNALPLDRTGCAPPPFVGSTITVCDLQPNAALYGSH